MHEGYASQASGRLKRSLTEGIDRGAQHVPPEHARSGQLCGCSFCVQEMKYPIPKSDEEMLAELYDDVEAINALISTNDSQPVRRAFIRSIFAAIEGTLHIIRGEVISAVEKGNYKVSAPDMSYLKEESYTIDKISLETRSQDKYIPVDVAIRFAFKHFSSMQGVPYLIDTSTEGWRSFRNSQNIRNRITHPRQPIDFIIDDDSLANARASYNWFTETYTDMYRTINKRLEALLNRVKSVASEDLLKQIESWENAEHAPPEHPSGL